jgi:site-specific DNA-methyltransferase (adenine-specific)
MQEEKISYIQSSELSSLKNEYDIIIYNTHFTLSELKSSDLVDFNRSSFVEEIHRDLDDVTQHLHPSSILFIYGVPAILPLIGKFINDSPKLQLNFKYWISLEYKDTHIENVLPCSHIGLLMYVKHTGKEDNPSYYINTKEIRIPYKFCKFCNENLRDWGGKKHLLNNLGAAVSDVWDMREIGIDNSKKIPHKCTKFIYDLFREPDLKMLVIEQDSSLSIRNGTSPKISVPQHKGLNPFKNDTILNEDSLKLMKDLSSKYPDGIFDMVFADPPYNLSKKYGIYFDIKSDNDYINWCNEWLDLLIKVLKPGGSLFVLNIPKWSIHHAAFLSTKMEFTHWIVWNALSTPKGKLMPAHYTLLYFTKPGGLTEKRLTKMHIESRIYCLRNSCLKKRKQIGEDEKEILTDVWNDIHRIKHKKDRDDHPCQLPIKLVKRAIEISTKPGDWIYDPFSGTGTTAVAANISNRHFVVSDIDKDYTEITKKNLERIEVDLLGNKYYVREKNSAPKKKKLVTNKQIEVEFIKLSKSVRRALDLEEIKELDSVLHNNIVTYYPDFKKLRKIANRRISTTTLDYN